MKRTFVMWFFGCSAPHPGKWSPSVDAGVDGSFHRADAGKLKGVRNGQIPLEALSAQSLGARVLVVSPTSAYQTIQAAITAGAALSPTSASRVLILVAPGTYVENITLAAFVDVCSFSQMAGNSSGCVNVTGTCTYVAPADATFREVSVVCGLAFSGTVTVNVSAKTGSIEIVSFRGCQLNGGASSMAFTGVSGATRALVRLLATSTGGGTWLDVEVVSQFSQTSSFALAVNGTSIVLDTGGTFGPMTLANTSTFASAQQAFGAFNGLLTVGATASADVRGYSLPGGITGPGAINRDRQNASTGAQSAGAGVVITFAVPFKDANYNVQLVQTAGAATVVPIVTAKAAANFTVTVPAGGATYDYTVVHN